MAVPALPSDMKVYNDQFFAGYTERVQQNLAVFNGNSANTIRLTSEVKTGEFSKESFLADIAGLVSHRDITSNSDANKLGVGQNEIVKVDRSIKVGPVSFTDEAVHKGNMSMDEVIFLIGQQAADKVLQNQIDAALNKEYDALFTRAERLGLPMDRVTEALEKQRDLAIGTVKAMQAGFQSMEAMKATFDSWLYDQSMSGVSSLTPMEKLQAAQENFGGLLSKAQGGDYSSVQQLLMAGQQLLTVGQGIYASSVSFASLESFVRSSISQIARDLDIPGYAGGTMSARSGLAWVGENGPELKHLNGGERIYNADESRMMARQSAIGSNAVEGMREDISAMRDDISKLSRQLGRLANKAAIQ